MENSKKISSTMSNNYWLALLAIVFGSLMVSLDSTIVSIANPIIVRDMHATEGQLQWITSGYLLSLAIFMIVAGKLGDRFGRKIIFTIGIVGFGLSSLAIGLSSSIVLFIAFRIIQGVFGALISTNALALIRSVMPKEKLSAGIGIFSSVNGLTVAIGPIIGGLIINYLNWNWAFYVNVFIGVISAVLALMLISETRKFNETKFDILGILTMAVFLGTLAYGLISIPEKGIHSSLVIGLLVVAAIFLVLFILVERKAKDPCIPLELFKNKSIIAGVVMTVLFMFALQGTMFYVMLYTEQIQGVTPLMAGIRLLPLGICLLVSAVISAPIIRFLRPRWALVISILIMSGGLFLATFTTVHSSYTILGICLGILGFGLGIIIPASTDALIGNASVKQAGAASSLQNTSHEIGGLLGVSVLGVIMANSTTKNFHEYLVNGNIPSNIIDKISNSGIVTKTVTQGVAPIINGASEQINNVIKTATANSFVAGMHSAMLVGTIICALGAIVALMVNKDTPTDVEEE